MTTRFTRDNIDFNAVATGYEGVNFTGLQVPSCGIEDMDKSVFNLFNDSPFKIKIIISSTASLASIIPSCEEYSQNFLVFLISHGTRYTGDI